MNDKEPLQTSDRSPEDLGDLHITEPDHIAAGKTAITETMRSTLGKMGVVRGTRALLSLNQKGGVDCQSCAWPDPEHRTLAEFCENGAKAMADEGTKARITFDFFEKYSLAELSAKDDMWLNAQGRLTHPMVLRKGADHYTEISWADALKMIAGELNALDSPDEAIFYTSGRTSNEAAFLYQLFVRRFGTNNLPDCSNMCHESSGTALSETIGLGKASIRLEDFKETDLVIVIGQNPGTCAPRMMSSLEDAKRAGAKMIAINPLAEAGLMNFVNPNPQHHPNPLTYPIDILANRPTHLADLHLPVRIDGDMAVLKGIMKTMLEREREAGGVFDREFIDQKTSGYSELIACLDSTSWDDILSASGLVRGQITEAAGMVMSAERMITCWAMGITQHVRSVETIQDIVNLHLLRGQIGKPGAGVCPVRGHSNVQGDRTMGIWEKVNERFFTSLEREFGFTVSRKDGFHTVEAIRAMNDGRAKVFVAMGGNFVSAAPDTEAVAKGLRKCRLTVQVITKLNRTALVTGEQFVSTESTMLNVQMSKGIFTPASKCLRSEPWIVANVAKAVLGDNSSIDWDAFASDYDLIRDAIERVIPGFEDYNRRIREKGGFYLPNKPREGVFETESGKAVFKAHALEKLEVAPGRLLLTTIRSHDQFNTTIYGTNDRYRGIEGGRRVIFINLSDIDELGLAAGSVVDITSHFDDGERHAKRFVVVPYAIPVGCAAAYFPEANPLVPLGSYAKRSGTPASKSIVISVKATGETAGEFA